MKHENVKFRVGQKCLDLIDYQQMVRSRLKSLEARVFS